MRVAHQTKSRTAVIPEAPVGRVLERRAYVRARLELPLSVSRIAGQATCEAPALHIHNISSSGAYFIYPKKVAPGTPLTLEVSLIEERPRHRSVRMCVDAHVVRVKSAGRPGWHGLAVAFDEIRYMRNGNFAGYPGQASGRRESESAAAPAPR